MLAVKTVAHALEAGGADNGYGGVYGELYRRYQSTSYKNLPQGKLAEVLAWLHDWHAELSGDAGRQMISLRSIAIVPRPSSVSR
jgi:hypothetical protein